MKITYIAQDVDTVTGIGRVFTSLASGMMARGHEVDIVCQRCTLPSAHVTLLPGFSRVHSADKLLFRIGELRTARRRNADLRHSSGVGSWADVVSAGSCHRAAVEIQNALPLHRLRARNFGLYDRISLADEQRLMTAPSTRVVLAVSGLVREQLMQWYGLPAEKVVVVPNGIDAQKYLEPLDREAARVLYGMRDDRFTLGFLGNEFDRKGVQTIIEALPLLRDLPLQVVVAGAGDPKPYLSRAASLDVGNFIHFTGAIDRPETFLRVLDLFVFPVHYEPFGMVVTEAMAAGTPVITARTVGAVEGMTEAKEALFLDDPHSAKELAGVIRRAVEDRDLRMRLSAAGRAASIRFAWPGIIEEIERVYTRVLGD